MKRTVKYLISLLIGVAIVGLTACADASTEQASSTFGWSTTAAPVTTTAFTAESSSAATTFAPVTTSAPITTTAESVTTTVPVSTTAKPLTTTAPATVEPQEAYDYILNTKSMKFHEPDCGSAKIIKEENRSEFNGTRDELVAKGYSPCGNCNP